MILTVGVVVLLFVAWQLWIGDVIYGAQATAEGREQTEQWQEEFEADAAAPGGQAATPASVEMEPPILPRPAEAEEFAVLRIPRFGHDYQWRVAGGTTPARTLDERLVGHYVDAAMPGQVGNFALAAHRTTFGAPFGRIAHLRAGDAIVVEVRDGWFTYRFRNHEYVTPREVDVLLDVPQRPEVSAGDRYLTMTSCSPIGSMAERIVGFGLFESFTPRDAGAPASVTESPS